MTRYRCGDGPEGGRVPGAASCAGGGSVDVRVLTTGGPAKRPGRPMRQVAEAELVEFGCMRPSMPLTGTTACARMHDELRRAGLKINEKRVRRLMRLHGMAGRCRRRRCQTTFPGPDGYVIPDLVGRCFKPGAPDRAWVQGLAISPFGRTGGYDA